MFSLDSLLHKNCFKNYDTKNFALGWIDGLPFINYLLLYAMGLLSCDK